MLDPFNDCFDLASRRLTRVCTQVYDAALAPFGLKITQFSVLNAVHKAQANDLSLNEIAYALDMEQSSLTRALAAFTRNGLISLSPGKDRRRKIARLTPDGLALLQQALPAWERAQKDVRDRLGQAQFDEGRQILRSMRQGISNPNQRNDTP